MSTLAAPRPHLRRARLWVEFLVLFVGTPLLMDRFFGAYSLFAVVWIFTLLAAVLLTLTPGFRWRDHLRLSLSGDWRLIAVFTALVAATVTVVVLAVAPHRFLIMPMQRPELWLTIMILYPVLSAAPQEVIYRSLFFERYGALFPSTTIAVAVNGAAFALGHLFYDNPVTILMTGAGGILIAIAYLRGRSLTLAIILHGLAGQLVFTSGLGIYFYHGAVGATP